MRGIIQSVERYPTKKRNAQSAVLLSFTCKCKIHDCFMWKLINVQCPSHCFVVFFLLVRIKPLPQQLDYFNQSSWVLSMIARTLFKLNCGGNVTKKRSVTHSAGHESYFDYQYYYDFIQRWLSTEKHQVIGINLISISW